LISSQGPVWWSFWLIHAVMAGWLRESRMKHE
jgi:hypothetical protein